MIDIETHLAEISDRGFTILKREVDTDECQRVLEFATSFRYSPDEIASVGKSIQRLNGFADNIYNVVAKQSGFLRFFLSGKCGEILKRLLNDRYYTTLPDELPNYILRSLLLRSSKAAMPWHIDSFIPYRDGPISVVQAALFIEASNERNGCTLVVPGSHLSGAYAPQGENANAVKLEAEPGDLIIWDSRIWHATTSNSSESSRWALIATFTRWYFKQGYDYPKSLNKETYQRLSLEEKIVLGFCSSVPSDEFEKTEVKGGIQSLERWDRFYGKA